MTHIDNTQNAQELREQLKWHLRAYEQDGADRAEYVLLNSLEHLIASREQAAELRGRANELLGVISYSGYDVKTNIIPVQTRTVGERYVQLNDQIQATKPEKGTEL